MSRQMRNDFEHALHHITTHAIAESDLFRDDADRLKYLELLAAAVRKFGWLLYAYVLMTNHVHLVLETPRPTLSRGMQWVSSKYASYFNRKYGRRGPLHDGRFKSRLIEKDEYLLNVLRYVILNPVRAGMVLRPEDYRWSSYRATAGLEAAPEWLALGCVQGRFGEPATWQANYQVFVAEKIGCDDDLWEHLMHQIYLGTKEWAREMRKKVEEKLWPDAHPALQRTVGRPSTEEILEAVADALEVPRDEVRQGGVVGRMVVAWLSWWNGFESLRMIAATLRLRSSGYVSNLVARCERELSGDRALQKLVDRACELLPA